MSRSCAVLLLAAAAGSLFPGCASPRPSRAAPDPEALEEARRDERQRILQQYWYEQTAGAPRSPSLAPAAGPPLAYPAGIYDGLRFAPRLATSPSLEEPER